MTPAARLRAALAAVLVQAEAPELAPVHRWLDNWDGIGLLAIGLHRIGYDLDLRRYGDGHWRASFYVTGSRTLSLAARRGSLQRGELRSWPGGMR